MTNNNWIDELHNHFDEKFKNVETWKYDIYISIAIEFISNLLTKKDQEHKAELEMIKGEINPKPMNTFPFVLQGEELELYMRHKGWNECREYTKEILDKHINK